MRNTRFKTEQSQQPSQDRLEAKTRAKIFQWVRRGVAYLAGLVGVAALTGIGYQTAAAVRDERRYPPPGEMVEVGDHRLHLNVTGEKNEGPTVILESGAGAVSPAWARIQPEVAKFSRVVSYDRPGLGWSEGSPTDLRSNAQQLHSALKKADVPGPYVMIGHSLGGLHVRAFASEYSEEISGMVLVDPTTEDLYRRMPQVREDSEKAAGESGDSRIGWTTATPKKFRRSVSCARLSVQS